MASLLRPGKARKLAQLERTMRKSGSYDDWRVAALEHDEVSGQKHWRKVDQTSQYDYSEIRLRLDRLRSLRARHDYHGLLFTLNEGIHGNMGGMGRSSLYRRSKFGTKHLIEEYINEVDESLRVLAELDVKIIDAQEKLDFFYRANVCFGRSALMLSGGGVLGFYHLGVVKTLLEHGLLPRVISGASAGAIIAGVLACHTDEELQFFFEPTNLHFEAERESSVFSNVLFGTSLQIEASDLESTLERLIPDMTFQEAYEKTGRQVSVTVAPAELHQRSRLLNAITSPNVYVRSAVQASCAVPGVFPPVMLMAKNVHGEQQPYLPTRRWVDGSVADDLPAKRLQRLYSANHFIASQVNPIVLPFVGGEGERGLLAESLAGLSVGMSKEVLNFYRRIGQKQGENWPKFNAIMAGIHSLVDQDYSGDINITPSFRWYNPTKILSHVSEEDLLALLHDGEQSTYPVLEAVRLCTRISRTMEEILQRFETGDLRPGKSGVKLPRTSRRRPPVTRADRSAMREDELQLKIHDKPKRRKTATKKTAAVKAAARTAGVKKTAARKTSTGSKAKSPKAPPARGKTAKAA